MMPSKHFKMALPSATGSRFFITGWSFTADVPNAGRKRSLKEKDKDGMLQARENTD
jgi:hypothetical protein